MPSPVCQQVDLDVGFFLEVVDQDIQLKEISEPA